MKRASNSSSGLLGQLRQMVLPLGVMIDAALEENAAAGYQGDTFREAPAEKISFAESVRKQRLAVGLTQGNAAKLVPVSCITFKRWEAGRTVPVEAVQREVMKVLGGEQARKSCPGKRKLAALVKSHHLHWEKHKGWMLRVTVDLGPKVVGKRVKFRLGTKDLEEALKSRELVLSTLRKLGLTLKISKSGPKRRAKVPGVIDARCRATSAEDRSPFPS